MKVFLIPRSGYINRIQALASAKILVDEIDSELHVIWLSQEVAPADPSAIFSTTFMESYFRPLADLELMIQSSWEELPLFLHHESESGVVSLAGNLMGEQNFMPELREFLSTESELKTLVVIAGGKYWLAGGQSLSPAEQQTFDKLRHNFYQQRFLSQEIEESAMRHSHAAEPFIGLHLRYSDRSHQAPLRSAITQAVLSLTQSTGISRVFIASDTPSEIAKWRKILEQKGLKPWSIDHPDYSRSDPRSAYPALIDWRVLTYSQGMVYFSESSFGEEAAVASGRHEISIALQPSRRRALVLRCRKYFSAGISYPRRHWFS